MKLEPALRAWNRFVTLKRMSVREGETAKIDNFRACFQYVGATRLRLDLLPDKLRNWVATTTLRGFSLQRNGNKYEWMQAMLAAYPYDDVKVGYICRDHMEFYVPYETVDRMQAFIDSFQALAALTGRVNTGRYTSQFRPDNGWLCVRARSQWREGDQGPAFDAVKKLVGGYLEDTIERRRKVVNWFLNTKEAVLYFK